MLLHEAWIAWRDARQVRPIAHHAGIIVIYSTARLGTEALVEIILRLLRSVHTSASRLFAWNRRNDWQEYLDRVFSPLVLPEDTG